MHIFYQLWISKWKNKLGENSYYLVVFSENRIQWMENILDGENTTKGRKHFLEHIIRIVQNT